MSKKAFVTLVRSHGVNLLERRTCCIQLRVVSSKVFWWSDGCFLFAWKDQVFFFCLRLNQCSNQGQLTQNCWRQQKRAEANPRGNEWKTLKAVSRLHAAVCEPGISNSDEVLVLPLYVSVPLMKVSVDRCFLLIWLFKYCNISGLLVLRLYADEYQNKCVFAFATYPIAASV